METPLWPRAGSETAQSWCAGSAQQTGKCCLWEGPSSRLSNTSNWTFSSIWSRITGAARTRSPQSRGVCGWRSRCEAVIGGLQTPPYCHKRLCIELRTARCNRRSLLLLFYRLSMHRGCLGVPAVASFAPLVQRKIGNAGAHRLQNSPVPPPPPRELSWGAWETHTWTFLTTSPSSFDTISAPSFSLSQSSFRLNKTLPCHGILKAVNMCMSNAMNMDVTSFFGAWPPACPHAGSPLPDCPPPGTRHYFWMSTACVGDTQTHTEEPRCHNHRHTRTHVCKRVRVQADQHGGSHALPASRASFFTDLSQRVLHENKGQRGGKTLMQYLFMCIHLELWCI